jgi:hypothetical protein
MIWEVAPVSEPVINSFKTLERLGQADQFTISHAGDKFVFYSLTIASENLADFKREVRSLRL